MTMTDAAARRTALSDLGRSLHVEAGAGTGKTSLLAGRIVSLLANGAAPSAIAAVTFTEMAAAELLGRVGDFVEKVVAGNVPPDIAAAFEGGVPSRGQIENLESAQSLMGDLTCTTIHGFCQRLIKPYPVEADIDPGAQILDPVEASLAFEDIFDKWIRGRLSGHDPDETLVTSLVSMEAKSGVALVRSVADALHDNPGVSVPRHSLREDVADEFAAAVQAFEDWYAKCGYQIPEHELFLSPIVELRKAATAAVGGRPHLLVVKVALALKESYLVTGKGTFRAYKCKGKWQTGAPNKGMGGEHFEEAKEHYERCTQALDAMRRKIAAAALTLIYDEVQPLMRAYAKFKRESASLDFGDLLTAAAAMLRDHPDVRAALGAQYRHVLVDEFQDTDPLQTDIFLHLSFDKVDGEWKPRPGAIFLVGDPKQAIYRFRGADVGTYVRMRELMQASDADCFLSVSTNFRSLSSILDHVNIVFEGPLGVDGQPGFTRLSAHRTQEAAATVAYFDVDDASPGRSGAEPKIGEVRAREAEIVADLCSRLIGSYEVFEKNGDLRLCHPGDIALLVPQGTDLHLYENALERAGIAVATQAGKGLYRQQEVHDLIALLRVLADPRDTLALGAFLRGPLVGLTEQELLDETHRLPDTEDGGLSFLRVGMDLSPLALPVLIDAMAKLDRLRLQAETSTPHAILNRSVDEFAVRPKIKARFHGNPERQLSNVDRFLEMSRPYSVRGLRAFSDAMRKAWEDGERVQEGRPDEEERSVSLITMHSSKGLEWPIVIPVNTVTSPFRQSAIITDVASATMTMPFLGLVPEGYDEARLKADAESALERMRIWYVAATRAKDLLVVPRFSREWKDSWARMVDLCFDAMTPLDVAHLPTDMPSLDEFEENKQDAAVFRAEHAKVVTAPRILKWAAPSRHEWSPSLTGFTTPDDLVAALPNLDPYAGIDGGAERGIILHKLMEEILNSETEASHEELKARAETLSRQFLSAAGREVRDLIPDEMARTVLRTLEIPLVAELRPRLLPEVATVGSWVNGNEETVMYGLMDTSAVMEDGTIDATIDWKSDVRPSASATRGYVRQVTDYIETNEIERGYIVYMTTAQVVEVPNRKMKAA
jgi:exodeoxyribonuclease-5